MANSTFSGPVRSQNGFETVSINSTTGAITSSVVAWKNTPSENTPTDYYFIIGSIEVVDGVPDTGTINQATYGPVMVIVHGKYDVPFGVIIF